MESPTFRKRDVIFMIYKKKIMDIGDKSKKKRKLCLFLLSFFCMCGDDDDKYTH